MLRHRRVVTSSVRVLRWSTVAYALVSAVFVVLAVHTFGLYERSEQTQKSGVADSGRITAVAARQHTSKSGSWWTTDADVTLDTPVRGAVTTTVHVPGRPPYEAGQHLNQMVVNGSEPAYSEIAGEPLHSGVGTTFVMVAFAAACVVVASLFARAARRVRRGLTSSL
jgi:membrane protein implicated in regulation of membrane protease activity